MMEGLLDRRITIQKRATLQHATHVGERVNTWVTINTVWAEDVTHKRSGKAVYAHGTESSEISKVFRIRYTDGLEANMRVLYNGQPYRILYHPQEGEGRRESLLLACTARATDEV
jgi:SPP1 family predicted phage head-tail adaptor